MTISQLRTQLDEIEKTIDIHDYKLYIQINDSHDHEPIHSNDSVYSPNSIGAATGAVVLSSDSPLVREVSLTSEVTESELKELADKLGYNIVKKYSRVVPCAFCGYTRRRTRFVDHYGNVREIKCGKCGYTLTYRGSYCQTQKYWNRFMAEAASKKPEDV